jgi:hypothetical protein
MSTLNDDMDEREESVDVGYKLTISLDTEPNKNFIRDKWTMY